jgi:hypothetical protein
MRLNGHVSCIDRELREVEVTVSGRNGIGEHVSASITVHYPEKEAA